MRDEIDAAAGAEWVGYEQPAGEHRQIYTDGFRAGVQWAVQRSRGPSAYMRCEMCLNAQEDAVEVQKKLIETLRAKLASYEN